MRKPFLALALASLAIVGFGTTVSGQGSGDPVAERVNLMRSNGMLLRSAPRAEGDEAVTAARTFLETYTALPELFADPSRQGGARPEVWTNFDAFVAILEQGQDAAERALVAAEAGDTAGYAAGIQEILGTCSSCHSQFRR